MNRQTIPLDKFFFNPAFFEEKWLLLTAGTFTEGALGIGGTPASSRAVSGGGDACQGGRSFNSMTISWGSVGQLWNKPFFQVVVRPSRYTFGFMNENDTFTLCAFPPEYRKALALLGSKSGRDCDKICESGLTPIPSRLVPTPGYDEAELIVECRKLYWQDMDNRHFLDAAIEGNYSGGDYHRIFYGEILAVSGTPVYGAASK